jgi:hypothetical protein
MFGIALVVSCGTDETTNPPEMCMQGERAACDCGGGSTGTKVCTADGEFGACGSCSAPDPDPAKVNFKAEILNRSCGTSGVTGCHGRDAYGANKNMECRGWLTLEDAALGSKFYSGTMNGQTTGCADRTLYQRITQLKVWQCMASATNYVTPGDVSKSYILNKLNGVNMCKESASSPSDQMPPANSLFSITAPDKALIQQWIAEGGLDN